MVRKQKNDKRDAGHILKLMREDNFPQIWMPSPENRDLRQLVWHRHRLVGISRPSLVGLRRYHLIAIAVKMRPLQLNTPAIAGVFSGQLLP